MASLRRSRDLSAGLIERPIGDDAAVLAEPERDGELLLALFGRRELARSACSRAPPRRASPATCSRREAEAAMGLRLAQEFEAVRREIDHEKPPAGRDEAGRLADRARGIVEVVQHLMDDDEVEGVARERRRVDVALPQLDAGEAGLLEIGAGDREHGVACIEPDGPRTPRREELQHAAGAGAEIERGCGSGVGPSASSTAASTAASGAWRDRIRSHSGASRAKKAWAACARCARTASSRVRSSRSCWSARSRAIEHRPQDPGRRAPVGQPEEGPGALAVALHEAGLDQKLQMARDARLRLAQDVGEVGDRQLALGQQGQDPQPRLLGGGPQDAQASSSRVGAAGSSWPSSLSHIKICLYLFSELCKLRAHRGRDC